MLYHVPIGILILTTVILVVAEVQVGLFDDGGEDAPTRMHGRAVQREAILQRQPVHLGSKGVNNFSWPRGPVRGRGGGWRSPGPALTRL